MHHAIANADTNYHIDPNHDNAPSVLEMPSRGRSGDIGRTDDQPWLVSALRGDHDQILCPRHRSGSAQHNSGHMLNPFTLLGVLAPFKGDKRPTWFTNPETFSAADFQRFKDSRIDAMHIGVGTAGPNAYHQVMWFLGLWNGFIAHHGEHLMRVDGATGIDAAKSSGKIGIILGLQNSEHFRRQITSIDFINSDSVYRCSPIIAAT